MKEQPKAKPYRFGFLLLLLLLYLFGSPFLLGYPSLSILAHFCLSLTLCLTVYTVEKEQNYRSIAMVLILPVLILYWLGLYDLIPFNRHSAYILLAIYFLLLIVAFTTKLMNTLDVTINVIFETLCLYLIIGLFWGILYALLYDLSPGSYAGTLIDDSARPPLAVFNYFSMVTLTTLGYGDITPQTPGAGALCQMEAIIGQLFIAVVVAWLVADFVTDKQKKRNQ